MIYEKLVMINEKLLITLFKVNIPERTESSDIIFFGSTSIQWDPAPSGKPTDDQNQELVELIICTPCNG
jgi:hypothetical protein